MTMEKTVSSSCAKEGLMAFQHVLPPSRLGKWHDTIESFRHASNMKITKSKEYTLVVVTESHSAMVSSSKRTHNGYSNSLTISNATKDTPSSTNRILLGLKNRGFGKGMYNSFGGKFDTPEETVEECACRELREETNLQVTITEMESSKVGVQHFTFEDSDIEMIVHVFRIHLDRIALYQRQQYNIQGCDEITPQWFQDWTTIPFHNMFADDSLWLTKLLSSSVPLTIHGWYHFLKGGQETNTILHYYMDVQSQSSTNLINGSTSLHKNDVSSPTPNGQHFTLEKKLFHALHDRQIHSPSLKEFKEGYAFCNSVRSTFAKSNKREPISIKIIVDVAGGPGTLAGLFLARMTSVQEAIVIDPAQVGKNGVCRAWKDQFFPNKTLRYRYECLRTALPDELFRILQETKIQPQEILVVACHACQHLSEEIIQISCNYGVHVAVMPCCQKDTSPGSVWKTASKNLSIPFAKVMDVLLAGKVMANPSYDVRMKVINSDITPQNRIIICRAVASSSSSSNHHQQERIETVAKAHERLERAYRKAHYGQQVTSSSSTSSSFTTLQSIPMTTVYLMVGFAAGILTATTLTRR